MIVNSVIEKFENKMLLFIERLVFSVTDGNVEGLHCLQMMLSKEDSDNFSFLLTISIY